MLPRGIPVKQKYTGTAVKYTTRRPSTRHITHPLIRCRKSDERNFSKGGCFSSRHLLSARPGWELASTLYKQRNHPDVGGFRFPLHGSPIVELRNRVFLCNLDEFVQLFPSMRAQFAVDYLPGVGHCCRCQRQPFGNLSMRLSPCQALRNLALSFRQLCHLAPPFYQHVGFYPLR